MLQLQKSTQTVPYELIGINVVDASWNGAPLVLETNQNANLPETPNGAVVFAYQNEALQNNQGSIAITSGGSEPVEKQVPALANQPSIIVNNWKGNNLSVTNISANSNTPIRIQAVGPGMPGTNPQDLPIGQTVNMAPGQTAQGLAEPRYMQVVLRCSSGNLGVLVIIGGPLDANGENSYPIMVNYSANTGPGTGNTPPEGYYATTTSNDYAYQFNWGSSTVFVANMSGDTAGQCDVVLRAL